MTNTEDATPASETEIELSALEKIKEAEDPVEESTASATEPPGDPDEGRSEKRPEPFAFPADAQKLDIGHIKAERIACFILFGSISIAVICSVNFAALAIFWPPGWGTLLFVVASLLILAVMTWFCISFPKLQYDRTRWRVTGEGFEIRSGVIWKSIHVIPHDRVQHTDVTQGPLQRRFGISTLTIHTAGTSNASVQLEGLAMAVAGQLRDHLISRQSTSGEENATPAGEEFHLRDVPPAKTTSNASTVEPPSDD
ncbi:MAG: PH domain-containing protein [Planctomycetota bacterium]